METRFYVSFKKRIRERKKAIDRKKKMFVEIAKDLGVSVENINGVFDSFGYVKNPFNNEFCNKWTGKINKIKI